jgi:signal transduction histidine kinase
LKRRISRTFLLQAAGISVAAVVGVYLAAAILQEVLVTEALRQEAEYYWERQARDPQAALPDTRNLRGFLATADGGKDLPDDLRGLDVGFHDVRGDADFTTVYVTAREGRRLYLVFDGERVNELAAYFGLVPLMLVLLVLYLAVWLAYRASHRAVSPVSWLAREVNRLDPYAPDPAAFAPEHLPRDADAEVQVLAAALGRFAERLGAFVERERNFTRDASHELRTPLTVIRIASDMLLNDPALPEAARVGLERIGRSARDMEVLVEAFLLLAREADHELTRGAVCVNDLVVAELERAQLVAGRKPIEVVIEAACRLLVPGSEKVVSALVGNLVRNAFSYTDAGRVSIGIAPQRVVIEDSGVGMDEQHIREAFEPFFRGQPQHRGGHGVGLTIVRRLSERFNWPVRIESEPGVGTRVTVDFPEARCEPLAADGGEPAVSP